MCKYKGLSSDPQSSYIKKIWTKYSIQFRKGREKMLLEPASLAEVVKFRFSVTPRFQKINK